MTFTVHKSRVKTIRQGDPSFMLQDGFALVPRAMIHVLPECPQNVKEMINWAVSSGYLKCVASVYSTEHLRDVLAED